MTRQDVASDRGRTRDAELRAEFDRMGFDQAERIAAKTLVDLLDGRSPTERRRILALAHERYVGTST